MVSLQVFDLSGRNVANLVHVPQTAGNHRVTLLNGRNRDLPDGIYICRLSAEDKILTQKIIISR